MAFLGDHQRRLRGAWGARGRRWLRHVESSFGGQLLPFISHNAQIIQRHSGYLTSDLGSPIMNVVTKRVSNRMHSKYSKQNSKHIIKNQIIKATGAKGHLGSLCRVQEGGKIVQNTRDYGAVGSK